MTAANWPHCLQIILGFEGGFVNNPRDPGGATNKGVTQATLSNYLHRQATEDDVRNISDATVEAIYRDEYWDRVQGDALPDGVDLIVFDEAVNQGPGTASKTLQRAVGATADGIIGPATLAAVAAFPAPTLVADISDARERAYRQDAGFDEFGDGWISRLDHCTQLALGMTRRVIV